jgi:hypothetical protein
MLLGFELSKIREKMCQQFKIVVESSLQFDDLCNLHVFCMQHGGISSLIRQLLKRTQVMHLKILIGHQKIWSHLGISLGATTIFKCQFPEVNYSKQLKMRMQPYNSLFIKTPQNWKMYTRIRKMKRENSQDVKLAQTRCEKLSMSKK